MKSVLRTAVLAGMLGIGLLQPGSAVYAAEKTSEKVSQTMLSAEEKAAYEKTKQYEKNLTNTDVPYPIQYLKRNKKTVSGNRRRARAVIPSSYDSRKQGIKTPVKDQDITGTCWAHAILDSAQADYMTTTGTALDLSEWQLAYFTYQQPVDPLSLTKGDGAVAQYEEDGEVRPLGSYYYYYTGGNTWLSMFSYAKGIGGGLEETAVFDDLLDQIDEEDGDKRAYLNEAKSYLNNTYRLTATDIVSVSSQQELLKQMIMQHGAGTFMYYANPNYYNYELFNYYSGTEEYDSNHVVSVVGWDDDYPKEYFDQEPEHDGAWLIKNSYGEQWGNDGYFWMSYDEGSIQDGVAVFYSVDANRYDNVYQYDGSMGVRMTEEDAYSKMANCFTVQNTTEQLKEVSFYTIEDDTDYEITIYKDLTDPEDPESGTPVATISGSKPVSGYCSVALDTAVALSKGETYSVVVEEQVEGKNTPFYLDQNVDYGWVNCVSKAEAGQSFLCGVDGWEDVSKDGQTNVRVKAFTDNATSQKVENLQFQEASYEVSANQSVATTVLSDGKTVADDSALTYTVEDSLIASVDGHGVVYGKSAGTTTVTVSCGEQKASCKVTVNEQPVTELIKEEGYATKENPLQIEIGKKITLSYCKQPEYGAGTIEWTVADPNAAEDEEEVVHYQMRRNGVFQAYKAGDYEITATVRNGKTSSSVTYYVSAVWNLTECGADVTKLTCSDTDGTDAIRIYTYESESRNTKPLKIHFDKNTNLGDSRLYLLDGISDVADAVAVYLRGGEERLEDYPHYTKDELSDQSVYVSDNSFTVLLIAEGTYEWKVDSVEKLKPLTILKYQKKEYTYPVTGTEDKLLPVKRPEDTNEEIIYTSSRPSVATVDPDGTLHIGKPGKTVITATAAYSTTSKESEERRSASTIIRVTEDTVYDAITFQQSAIKMQRNEELDLTFNEPVDGYDVTYTSSAPGKVYVDENGHVIAAGVVEDATITATLTINGKEYTATAHVTVTAPDPMTVQDMQSVHYNIPGMDEYYTYVADETVQAMKLYFDSKSYVGSAEDDDGNALSYIEVLDANKKTVAKDTYFVDQTVVVPGNTAIVHVVRTTFDDSEEDDDDCIDVGDYGEDDTYGFRVKKIDTGNATTAITLDDITLDLRNRKTKSVKVKAKVTPADATDKITYTVEDPDIAEFYNSVSGQLEAISNGTTKITATTASGYTATATVTVIGTPMQSVRIGELEPGMNSITMKAGDEVSYPIITTPADTTERLLVEYDSDVLNAYVGVDGIDIEAWRGGDTSITLRTPSGSVSQTIQVHVDSQNPGKKRAIADRTDFSECKDGNAGIAPEQMTIEKLQSVHPYTADSNIMWSYNKPGAESVTITFDGKTYLEEDVDYLYIYSYDGKGIGRYTYDSLMNQSITIAGSGFRLVLVTDESEEEYGFALKDIQVKMQAGETEKPDAGKTDSGSTGKKDPGSTGNKTDGGNANGTVTGNTTESGGQKPTPDTKPDSGSQVTVGSFVTVGKEQYKITTAAGDTAGTVTFVKSTIDKKQLKVLTIPATVTIEGKMYSVTAIEKNACKGYVKLKKLVIGKKVEIIGANAFAGCKALKRVKVQTTLLTKKTIGKKAFAGIHKKAVIKVPKKKKKEYQKALYSRATKKSVKIR